MQDRVENLRKGRTAWIAATITLDEKARIEQLAATESMSASSWLRRLVLREFARLDEVGS